MRLRLAGCVVLFILFICPIFVWGSPVTVGGAEEVADAFIGYEQEKNEVYRAALGISADVRLYEAKVLTDGALPNTLAYVFELDPSGYIVVTADTQIVPIVAYSFTGTFSWEESTENILLDMLRQDMANRLRAVQDGQMDSGVAADNERCWEEYRGTLVLDRATYEVGVYGPWTLDAWHQNAPYYDDCPMDPNTGDRCIVGCSATALAQILNYWQYPTSVTFQTSDNYTSSKDPDDGYGTRTIPIVAPTANFYGLDYDDCNPSDAAKAALSFAAGVSIRMDYSSAGSGALATDAAPALAGSPYPQDPPKRWGYHSADVRTYTNSHWGSPFYITQTAFFNDLKNNMMQAQPAIMTIFQSAGGGHAIIVDGYHPTNDDYHLNFGWGTSAYGWYSLPLGFPSGYDILDSAVYNIVPTTSTYTMSTSTSGTGTGTVQALPGTGALIRGTHVLVSATPAPGSSFSHWTGDLSGSDNPAMLILDDNKSANAVFDGGGGPVVVNFPDPGLEAAIRDEIEKPTGDIYDTDLIGLTYLDASYWSISNLEGIQHCVNLTVLSLWTNQISDISLLSGLINLTGLDLGGNQIVGISPLSGLTNLTWLWLDSNQIVDIAPLVNNAGIDSGDDVDISWNYLCLYPGSQDMENVEELLSRGVSIEYDGQTCISDCAVLDHELSQQGWHMVSIPGGLCDPCTWANGEVCGDLVCALSDDLNPCYIFYYDPGVGGYVMAPPAENICYQTGRGFWTRTYEDNVLIDAEVTVLSDPVEVPLENGWNQIGNPFTFEVSLDDVTVRYGGNEASLGQAQANGWVSMYLFGYDPVSGGYVMVYPPDGVLQPWGGYWIRAYVDCEVCIPPAPAPPSPPMSALVRPADLNLKDIPTPPPPPYALSKMEEVLASELRVVNIPNPIRSEHTTTFKVEGKAANLVQAIRVDIYDQRGQLVFTQEIAARELAWHTVNDAGELLANGVYLYQVWVKIGDTWHPTGIHKLAVYR